MNRLAITTIVLFVFLGVACKDPQLIDVTDASGMFTSQGIKINGKYRYLRGGSLQWFRLAPETWEDRIIRFKAAGFNTIGMYIAWNQIEPKQGQFNFDNPNIEQFLKLAQKHGLYVLVRPGPYITNEMDGGGLPAWLTRNSTKKNFEADGRPNIRTHDKDFIDPVRTYLTELNRVLKPYLITNGGPIVMYAIENEYNWFERASALDHLFWYEGGLERPLDQKPSTTKYITALRDIVEESGIDVPIVTCPGDGKVSATGDVPRVYPFPNIYEWAVEEQPDEAAWKILRDMHSTNHSGVYRNVPSGSLEVNRSAQEFRRLLSGGLDAFFAFNVVGMAQEGYMNAVVLSARAGDVNPHWGAEGEPKPEQLETIVDFSADALNNGFFSPTYGYFPNVVDYNGAISPSGVLNDSWFQFRRDNFFYDLVENKMAAAGESIRTRHGQSGPDQFYVDHPKIGSRDKEGYSFYRLESPEGGALLSIVNQTGQPILANAGSIKYGSESFPKYSNVLFSIAQEDRTTYTTLLLNDYQLDDNWFIDYSTAEVLTYRQFNSDTALIVYGEENQEAEIAFKGAGPFVVSDNIEVHENTDSEIVFTFRYDDYDVAHITDSQGHRLRLIMSLKEKAGKFWFFEVNDEDIIVGGLDFVNEQTVAKAGGVLQFKYDFDDRLEYFFVLAPNGSKLSGTSFLRKHNIDSDAAFYQHVSTIQYPTLPNISVGRTRSDIGETSLDYNISLDYNADDWVQWQGEPSALEFVDIFKGHAWYRTEFKLDQVNSGDLFVESASDFVGIYVNGQYITTVAPLGTEIDNRGQRRYRFPSLAPFLKQGDNVIAFRTEIWGHGSFMFGRGSLIATQAKFPALGYEGLKGLHGQASLGDIDLVNWSAISALGGERNGFNAPELDDAEWDVETIPLQLTKGDIKWFRTTFDGSNLPPADEAHAPIVLRISGYATKATIFLNGRLIGRWLSDSDWLYQGSWGRPARTMWVPLNPDDYPLMHELIKEGKNTLALVFEDTSAAGMEPGRIDSLSIEYNEELRRNDVRDGVAEGVRGRASIVIE